jgi:ribonuclease HI
MTIEIYTDGSCKGNPGKGSWAMIVFQDKKIIDQFGDFDPSTTNNKMELTAILQALQYIKHKNIKDDVIIHSDSEYSVKSINLWIDGWIKRHWKNVKNTEILKPISVLKNELQNVKYVHVRGHNGDYGNELVDKLCNDIIDNNK